MTIAIHKPVINCAISRDANRWIALAGRSAGNGSNRPVDAVVDRDRESGTTAAASVGQIYCAVVRRYLDVTMQPAALGRPCQHCGTEGLATIQTQRAIRRPQSLSA